MADSSVRPARLVDVDDLVAVQLRALATLPGDVWPLPDVDSLDAGAMTRSWERAVLLPPSGHHHVLVATAGDVLVGLAVVEPAGDPDFGGTDEHDRPAASRVAEVTLLVVDPQARGVGHGSRLLSAVADVSAAAGVTELVTWLPAPDDDARRFLAETGWAPDGAHRSVEVERFDGSTRTVRELRYATLLDVAGS